MIDYNNETAITRMAVFKLKQFVFCDNYLFQLSGYYENVLSPAAAQHG
jgi:hypothetical protein